jgi:ATP-binding cassette subfamily C (CFTR/MRP) protein 2
VAIVGNVGAGKSSLMNAMIGNMKFIRLEDDSKVSITGDVAYTNQVAWVLNATIRDNILFGSDHDETRYQKVL